MDRVRRWHFRSGLRAGEWLTLNRLTCDGGVYVFELSAVSGTGDAARLDNAAGDHQCLMYAASRYRSKAMGLARDRIMQTKAI
ncbi:MAG TPA: hypothetical protein VGU46_12575 [Acidobacteriaceae bacterium]|nr:hypothetical protein [Acidobacteriaceae bacterium]